MLQFSRRGLARLPLLGLCGLQDGLAAPAPASPKVGTIRWDAWYAPESVPTQAVTRSLAPAQYHRRLPFFASVSADLHVQIDGNNQAIMDREIAAAADAGIDYWAFVGYRPTASTSIAFHLYRASSLRRRMRFCMFAELGRWGEARRLGPMALYHLQLMRDPLYMRVAGGRPLYYLGFFTDAVIARDWGGLQGLRAGIDDFRQRAVALGVGNPYIVLSASPAAGAAWAAALGLDALGAYAIAAAAGPQPYRALASLAEQRWQEAAATGLPVVPTVMTGWDRRPRIEAPVPWERTQQPGVGMENFYETAQPDEIAAHLVAALDFVRARPAPNQAETALVYAWNENDEGGWLIPTYPNDDGRLRAVGAALRAWRAAHP